MKPHTQERIKRYSNILKNLKRFRSINNEEEAVIIYDLDILEERMSRLVRQFPNNSIHTTAIKANPLPKVLAHIASCDFGAEVASEGELYIAMKSGFDPEKIVFDSPVKTEREILFALKKGININIDNFSELERIKKFISNNTEIKSRIGLRINPQIGEGEIAMTSVAGEYSKFGIALNENQEKIIQVFLENPWLNGLHVHIGSQTCTESMLVDGIEAVTKLMRLINKAFDKKNIKRKIEFIDIGGGLPVPYYPGPEPVVIEKLINKLKTKCPELWNGQITVITELGRWLHAPAAFALSKIEYIKNDTNLKTIINHIGADMFIRESYRPEDDWHHEIDCFDSELKPLTGLDKTPYNIAGPLCFSGDFLRKEIYIPVVKEGDYLLIHDVGAYTFSMWSRYNSRPMPKIIGIRDNGKKTITLKPREEASNATLWWS
ncbi:MAG: hypothetical protein ACEPOV_03780 [Hyphomicrobiales bacterium]